MGSDVSITGKNPANGLTSGLSQKPSRQAIIRAGIIGGLTGAIIIWIYEAVVWVGVQHLMPMAGIPRNATGLVFGKEVQESIGIWAYIVGTGIHFVFSMA